MHREIRIAMPLAACFGTMTPDRNGGAAEAEGDGNPGLRGGYQPGISARRSAPVASVDLRSI